MINYSIVMRSVNANLFEINQAKSRIKKAQSESQKPAQADLDLVAQEKHNAFAVAQYSEVMTIEKFARHIASHGCVYGRADISAILYMAVDCIREMLLEGKKVRLGDLGDFAISLSSKGAEKAENFSSQNITGIKVWWEPGSEFKNLMSDAEFQLVASRKTQQAVLNAIKTGQTSVDISQPDTPNYDGDGQDPDDTPSGGGDKPSGSGSEQKPSGSGDSEQKPSGSGSEQKPSGGGSGTSGDKDDEAEA